MYSKTVMDHVANPRNVGPLADATYAGTSGSPGDGPYVRIQLLVEQGRIAAAAYQTYGCPAAIACASALVELATGKTFDKALSITPADVLAHVGGVPSGKESGAELAAAALSRALSSVSARS